MSIPCDLLEESEDDETGDPSKPPGEGSEKTVDPDHLMPFHHGWRREVVMRLNERDVKVCDIYYIPPEGCIFVPCSQNFFV